jgi:hypothetical protein
MPASHPQAPVTGAVAVLHPRRMDAATAAQAVRGEADAVPISATARAERSRCHERLTSRDGR